MLLFVRIGSVLGAQGARKGSPVRPFCDQAPHFLHKPLLARLYLVLVLRLILSFFPNLVLLHFALVSFLDRFLFVFYRNIQGSDPLLPLRLVSSEFFHQVVKKRLRLQFLLARLHMLGHLLIANALLGS